MNDKQPLFGTSGIRGDAEKLFTNQFSFDLGRSFAVFLKNHKADGYIAVGYDPRDSSPRITEAVVSGLVFEERQVYNEGVTPIPSINYLLKIDPGCAGSLMITGSHIKAHLNGIKFFAFGEEISKEYEKEIENIYQAIAGQKSFINLSRKALSESRAREEYQNYLIEIAKSINTNIKIVVDPGNGAQADVAPYVLENLGFEVIEMNASIQQDFLSRDTEVEGDFKDLQARVLEKKADFGVGFDSDGDRVIFIDELGSFIPGDYTGTIIAREVKSRTVVTPINTSQVVDKIGKKVVRTCVGSPYVVAKMKELDCDFGFEANGGGIFKDMLSRDAGRTMVEIIKIIAIRNIKLSQLIKELPKYYLYRDKIDYKWELKDLILERAKEAFRGSKLEDLDGLKFWLDDSTWILFRSSMNAPEFRVFAESDTEQKASSLLKRGLALVNDIVSKHG